MGRLYLRNIAKETIAITSEGGYKCNGEYIELVGEDFSSVEVLSPERLEEIEEDEDEFFERAFCGSDGAAFYLIDCDSYEAANVGFSNPLVMNFANARHIGGGFLNGAMAQEECLCRNSTLYASISSEEAREMYDYNNEHVNAVDSDYMLLSEDVCVFRDVKGDLLKEPYNVSVITIPAPNKNGRAKNVPQNELDIVMKDRLRKMLYAAARYGYRTLVLGAWGCGAFGHSAKRVAQYYYDLFFEEGFNEFFDDVIFAILHDKDKIDAFAEVFGDKLEDIYGNDDKTTYIEANTAFPVCNHDGADENNIGYTVGLLEDGTPFEAEYWGNGDSYSLGIIMPEKKEFYSGRKEKIKSQDSTVIGFHNEVTVYDNSMLSYGMVDEGGEDELTIVQKYVDYVVVMGLVQFNSDVLNGTVLYRVDVLGNDLVEIKITLRQDGQEFARTGLHFKKFPNAKRKFEVITND